MKMASAFTDGKSIPEPDLEVGRSIGEIIFTKEEAKDRKLTRRSLTHR
jgi:hypothetical protein